ncbi:hypothetical protein L6452_35027 [Arctium lappa]|uniref:Uncharacterized protein n=1 Tax=Arctium lappa TaxID=4217 RepID=A0ACB8YJ14_ARCLA|nr:hypothetical protein L6452_35027 [Arctium lappa]
MKRRIIRLVVSLESWASIFGSMHAWIMEVRLDGLLIRLTPCYTWTRCCACVKLEERIRCCVGSDQASARNFVKERTIRLYGFKGNVRLGVTLMEVVGQGRKLLLKWCVVTYYEKYSDNLNRDVIGFVYEARHHESIPFVRGSIDLADATLCVWSELDFKDEISFKVGRIVTPRNRWPKRSEIKHQQFPAPLSARVEPRHEPREVLSPHGSSGFRGLGFEDSSFFEEALSGKI